MIGRTARRKVRTTISTPHFGLARRAGSARPRPAEEHACDAPLTAPVSGELVVAAVAGPPGPLAIVVYAAAPTTLLDAVAVDVVVVAVVVPRLLPWAR